MKSKIIVILFASLFFIQNIVNAQDCEQCALALKGDVMDEFQKTYNSTFHEANSIAFTHSFHYWDSVANTSNSDIESGGAYGIISGYLNGSMSKEDGHKQFILDSTAFSQNTDISKTTYLYTAQRMHSLIAYDAWSKCVSSCNNDGMFFSKTNNGNEVLVSLYFKHQDSTDKYPILVTLVNVEAVEKTKFIKGNPTIKGQETLTGVFRLKNPKKDGYIKVDIGGGYKTEPVILTSEMKTPAPPRFTAEQVKIDPGEFNEHATYRFSYGIDDPDKEKDLRESWRKMPWSGGLLYKEASQIFTSPTAKTLISNDSIFQWNLEIINKLGAKCFGEAQAYGGEAHAEPAFNTKITLPPLKDTGSYWTLILNCWSYSDVDAPAVGVGSIGTVTITSGSLKQTLHFIVSPKRNIDSTLTLSKLPPGEYTLKLQVPKFSTA
jgi:hypothetical protein